MYVFVRLGLIMAVVTWFIAACQPKTIPPPAEVTPESRLTAAPQLDADVEEYAVYAALLEENFAGGETEQVLIVDRTRVNSAASVERDLSQFQEVVPLTPDLVASFKERNQQPFPLEPNLDLSIEYQLMSQAEIDELQPKDEASGWQLFYELYPKTAGFVYLSRVGFSAEYNRALVYYSIYRYEQPIMGGYTVLSREDGRWVVGESYEWMT
jgi:hypothetical protein